MVRLARLLVITGGLLTVEKRYFINPKATASCVFVNEISTMQRKCLSKRFARCWKLPHILRPWRCATVRGWDCSSLILRKLKPRFFASFVEMQHFGSTGEEEILDGSRTIPKQFQSFEDCLGLRTKPQRLVWAFLRTVITSKRLLMVATKRFWTFIANISEHQIFYCCKNVIWLILRHLKNKNFLRTTNIGNKLFVRASFPNKAQRNSLIDKLQLIINWIYCQAY